MQIEMYETVVKELLAALNREPLDLIEKARLADRLQDMVREAQGLFMAQYERKLEEQDEKSV